MMRPDEGAEGGGGGGGLKWKARERAAKRAEDRRRQVRGARRRGRVQLVRGEGRDVSS
jgi:hypothetical protein